MPTPVYRFAGVTLTQESLRAAYRQFARNAIACARHTEDLASHVDVAAYVAEKVASANRYRHGPQPGEFISLAILQRAHWLQTGESVALLP